MNLGMLLKMLGVKISPEDLAKVEAIIPQIPARAQQLIAFANNLDARLKSVERKQVEILEALHGSDSDTRPAGAGATQRAIEHGTNGAG